MKTVAVRAVFKDGRKPVYSSPLAAGADLFADIDEPVVLESLERRLIPTGVFLEIPEGYEAQVRPRSGLAIKHGLSLVNTPGTIDADYRGEIKVIAVNLGKDPVTIAPGDRIAQLVIAPTVQARFLPCESLTPTERGEGGFGSTGV